MFTIQRPAKVQATAEPSFRHPQGHRHRRASGRPGVAPGRPGTCVPRARRHGPSARGRCNRTMYSARPACPARPRAPASGRACYSERGRERLQGRDERPRAGTTPQLPRTRHRLPINRHGDERDSRTLTEEPGGGWRVPPGSSLESAPRQETGVPPVPTRAARGEAGDAAPPLIARDDAPPPDFALLDFTGVGMRNAAGGGQHPRCSANGSDVASPGRSAGAQRSRSLTRPW
jgi:hypothetical protein